jgi:hypothetical protein
MHIDRDAYNRDSYVIGFYRDQTTFVRLPGLAKNSPTLTLPDARSARSGCFADGYSPNRRAVSGHNPRNSYLDKSVIA